MRDYHGEDLILATGAPGSGWSGGLRTLSFADEINNSDLNAEKLYFGPGARGHHFGTYFGPGEQCGGRFDRLNELSKEEIVAELRKPFAHFGGVKIIKSHQFAYHLDYLVSLFPAARIVCFFRETDELTFDWWHKCGGWSISHPKYDWYHDDERMKRQIAMENAAIKRFVTRNAMRVLNTVFDARTVFSALGLTFTKDSLTATPYGSRELFANLTAEERYYKVRFGTSLNCDPYLYMAIPAGAAQRTVAEGDRASMHGGRRRAVSSEPRAEAQ
jgi:hypothetical protein